jgi:hypothetical protein
MRQVFTLQSDDAALLAGPWSAVPRDDASYALEAEAGAPAAGVDVWTADYSADPTRAAQELRAGLAQQASFNSQLLEAERRLNDLRQRGPDASFDVTTSPAESELGKLVDEINAQFGETSYDTGAPGGALGDAAGRFQALVDRVAQSFSHLAQIDTRVEGTLYARTIVEWNGTMETAWLRANGPAQATLHGNTLALACAGRIAVFNKVALVARGAVVLSGLLLAPPGVGTLLALPGALRFVNDVLAEVQQR